jgi:hypothetical protein
MLSLYQVQELNQILSELTDNIANAIRTKQVKRRSKGLGQFEAPVNASGNLADSIEYEIGENEIRVMALSYIDNVIYGTPPGTKTEVSEIERWLAHKGLSYNPATVSQNIDRYGSSIWQEFQGSESNLLEDFITNGEINPEIINDIVQKVQSVSIENITEEILQKFKAA